MTPLPTSKPTLRTAQIADLALLIHNPKWCLLHDPGVGKTPPVCVYQYHRWVDAQEKTAWIMPKQLLRKNVFELLRFSHFEPRDIAVVDGDRNTIAAIIRSEAKVFLMGFDRFRLTSQELLENQPRLRVCGVDEIHMGYSTHKSQRTQAWYRAMRRIPNFFGMTGTLIRGRLDSAYPTVHVVEPRYYHSYTNFMNIHAVVDLYGDVLGWKNVDHLAKIISSFSSRRTFAEEYGEESKVIITELAQMSEKQREKYKEFEEKAILELEDAWLEAPTGGVFALRCRQIMQHPETWGLAEGETTGKDERLILHLEDHKASGKPLLIFAVFQDEHTRLVKLVERMGMSVRLMNGTVSNAKRQQIDEDFRAGKFQVLVGSPAIAAVGYNWEHVDHIVFTSLDYMDDSFFQAYRRAIRGVRSTPLLITILEYEDSIDKRIMQIIETKSKLANEVDPSREVFSLSVA